MGTPLQVALSWIVWCHPGMNEEEFYRQFRAFWDRHAQSDPLLKPFELNLEARYHFVKPWETPADSPAVKAVSEALGLKQAKSEGPNSGIGDDFLGAKNVS
jgi:hypothetical protein